MAANKTEYKKISNKYFSGFCGAVKDLLKLENVISNMKDASLDDSDKNNLVNLYDGSRIDTDSIKLDDMTSHFLTYMREQRNLKDFEQPKAVDAICIDSNNNWYLLEFKNRPICKKNSNSYDKEIVSDIKGKIKDSLWLLFSIASMSNFSFFSDDITDFARQHITYIVVVSREKNSTEYNRIRQSGKAGYTPAFLKRLVGYYFKDAYMLTEHELEKFIMNFKQ